MFVTTKNFWSIIVCCKSDTESIVVWYLYVKISNIMVDKERGISISPEQIIFNAFIFFDAQKGGIDEESHYIVSSF